MPETRTVEIGSNDTICRPYASLQEAAKDALMVQDACNMGGVVNSFNRAVKTVWVAAREEGNGTDWVNNHPVVRLFADKIASLCGMQGTAGYEYFGDAYQECIRIAAEVSNDEGQCVAGPTA